MSGEIEHLVKMVNQIAANLTAAGDEDAVATEVAAHLGKFWSPRMKQRIIAYWQEGGGDLTPVATKAIATLSA